MGSAIPKEEPQISRSYMGSAIPKEEDGLECHLADRFDEVFNNELACHQNECCTCAGEPTKRQPAVVIASSPRIQRPNPSAQVIAVVDKKKSNEQSDTKHDTNNRHYTMRG
jgi:hypothetical protein